MPSRAFRCPRSPTSASTTPSSASTTPSPRSAPAALRAPRRRRAPPRVLVLRPRGRPAPAAAAVHEQQLALRRAQPAPPARPARRASRGAKAPRKTDRAKWNADTSNAIAKTQALIDSLGENDPILRAMLRDAIGEMEAAGPQGRRLLERNDYEIKMTDALIHDDLVDEYGRDGIPGLPWARVRHSAKHRARTPTAPTSASAARTPSSDKILTPTPTSRAAAGCCSTPARKTADFGIELYTRSRNLSNCARDRAI